MKTILVNKDLCTRCGICSVVCPMAIIDPADESTLPMVADEKAAKCIQCGHCEVFCPSEALLLNLRPDERQSLPEGAGSISPEDMAFYLKKRRSVRYFKEDPVPKEKIEQVLDIARYAASGTNSQPVQWIVVHDSEKVKTIAGLTIDWMKTLVNSAHPLSGYAPSVVSIMPTAIDRQGGVMPVKYTHALQRGKK